jgi:transcriptional regulator with XRE-family HTH domain
MIEEHAGRVRELLDALIRTSQFTRKDLERRLGVSTGYLGKLLRGEAKLMLVHLLGVLEILEIEPSEFFRMAYPELPRRSALVTKLHGLTAGLRGAPADPAAAPFAPPHADRALSAQEVEEIVVRVIDRLGRR